MRIADTAGVGLAALIHCTTGVHSSGDSSWSSIQSADPRDDPWQRPVFFESEENIPLELLEPLVPSEAPTPAAGKRGGAPPLETTASAVAALQDQVRELLEARRQDRAQIGELRERVRALEMEMADLLAEDDRGETVTDPHLDWIEAHTEELRRYSDMWVAIDPRRGIVAQATDGDELADRLAALPPDERQKLLAIDVRLYV